MVFTYFGLLLWANAQGPLYLMASITRLFPPRLSHTPTIPSTFCKPPVMLPSANSIIPQEIGSVTTPVSNSSNLIVLDVHATLDKEAALAVPSIPKVPDADATTPENSVQKESPRGYQQGEFSREEKEYMNGYLSRWFAAFDRDGDQGRKGDKKQWVINNMYQKFVGKFHPDPTKPRPTTHSLETVRNSRPNSIAIDVL